MSKMTDINNFRTTVRMIQQPSYKKVEVVQVITGLFYHNMHQAHIQNVYQ